MASSTFIFATLLLAAVAFAQDPTCSTGVKAGIACCPAGCGKCGGNDCGARSRELKLQCCIGAIKNKPANCLTSDPPCKITTKDPDFMAGSDEPDPKCEKGLRKFRVCCPPECSMCGGKGCKKRGALIKSQCCPGQIKAGTRGCKDTGAPCVLFKKSTAPPEPTPMMTEMPIVTPGVSEPPLVKPRVCKSMRKKFIGGCFCYLLFDNSLKIKRARKFRMFCKENLGPRKKILSLGFVCRRFKSGPKSMDRVDRVIKRLNELIPICELDLPMIERRK